MKWKNLSHDNQTLSRVLEHANGQKNASGRYGLPFFGLSACMIRKILTPTRLVTFGWCPCFRTRTLPISCISAPTAIFDSSPTFATCSVAFRSLALLFLLEQRETVGAYQGVALSCAAVLPIMLPWLVAGRAVMDMAHSKTLSGFGLGALAAALEQRNLSSV